MLPGAAGAPRCSRSEELERRGWKIHKLCDALIDELVRSTSEAGNLKALRVLQASGAWRPEESTLALQVAHEAGTLTHLLTSFQLPLGDYPAIAQALGFRWGACPAETIIEAPSPMT